MARSSSTSRSRASDNDGVVPVVDGTPRRASGNASASAVMVRTQSSRKATTTRQHMSVDTNVEEVTVLNCNSNSTKARATPSKGKEEKVIPFSRVSDHTVSVYQARAKEGFTNTFRKKLPVEAEYKKLVQRCDENPEDTDELFAAANVQMYEDFGYPVNWPTSVGFRNSVQLEIRLPVVEEEYFALQHKLAESEGREKEARLQVADLKRQVEESVHREAALVDPLKQLEKVEKVQERLAQVEFRMEDLVVLATTILKLVETKSEQEDGCGDPVKVADAPLSPILEEPEMPPAASRSQKKKRYALPRILGGTGKSEKTTPDTDKKKSRETNM